jgi:hypothetical protein
MNKEKCSCGHSKNDHYQGRCLYYTCDCDCYSPIMKKFAVIGACLIFICLLEFLIHSCACTQTLQASKIYLVDFSGEKNIRFIQYGSFFKVDLRTGSVYFFSPQDSVARLFARYHLETYSFVYDSLRLENLKLKTQIKTLLQRK